MGVCVCGGRGAVGEEDGAIMSRWGCGQLPNVIGGSVWLLPAAVLTTVVAMFVVMGR